MPVKDWSVAQMEPGKLEEIHKLEEKLGVILIAWKRDPKDR